jgi:hypothetical protein
MSWQNLFPSWLNLYLLTTPFSFMVKHFLFGKTFMYFMAKHVRLGKTFFLHGQTFPSWQNVSIS